MAYNENIPQGSQKPKDSRPLIQNNFASIKTLVGVDHVNFDLVDQGKHAKVSLPVQAAAPVFAAGENGLYNKLFATTNKNETNIHKQTAAGTIDIPFTASFLSNTAPVDNQEGWTYLPSGILVKWENTVAAFNGLYTHTMKPGLPAFNHIFTVIVWPQNANTTAQTQPVRLVDILSNTQFRLFSNGLTFGYCLVIGD